MLRLRGFWRTFSSKESLVGTTFYRFPLRPEVHLGIMKLGVQIPTLVQKVAIPKLMDKQSILMIAQTGTGKTLAYVAPLVHSLLETADKDIYPKPKKPRALVIVPTRELAKQVLGTVRMFPLQSIAAAPGQAYALESKALFYGADVIVGTPARLLIHMQRYNLFLSDLQYVVIDEADTLCDTFYEKDVVHILSKVHTKERPAMCVVSATRTQAVSAFLAKHLQEKVAFETVFTSDAHTTSDQLEEVFVPTKGQRRMAVLHDVLAEGGGVDKNKTLVFTNTVQSCKSVYKDLLTKGLRVQSLHGEMKPTRRNQVIHDFKTRDDILVSTNLASRGLDLENVNHVVLYDFPYNIADYLHRVGRTARGGKMGKVSTIVRRRNAALVQQIQTLGDKPLSMRDATKAMWKVAKDERLRHALASLKKKVHKRRYRKRFGLAPAHNLGSPEGKKLMRAMKKRIKAVKLLYFLRKRGRLKKDQLIPKKPDSIVEASETQTVSTFVKRKDGRLQMLAKRRKAAAPQDAPSVEVPLAAGSTPLRRDSDKRRRKPFM